MRTRTEYTAEASAVLLDVRRRVVLLGSCFTDHIGARMRNAMWRAEVNPCGTLFNPYSIAVLLRLALGSKEACAESVTNSVFRCGDVWHSWLMDSSVSALSREDCISNATHAVDTVRRCIADADTQALILTLGSAHVHQFHGFSDIKDGYKLYEEAADGYTGVVGNCHKVPAVAFDVRSLSVDDTVGALDEVFAQIFVRRPDMKILLTVSPVRYLAYGFKENARSKASLLLACQELEEKWAQQVQYFPAYEIVTDDLRDYRWYASDMLHVTDQTADYVWQQFCATYLSESDRGLLRKAHNLRAALQHRSLVAGSEADIRHHDMSRQRLAEFIDRNPGLEF